MSASLKPPGLVGQPRQQHAGQSGLDPLLAEPHQAADPVGAALLAKLLQDRVVERHVRVEAVAHGHDIVFEHDPERARLPADPRQAGALILFRHETAVAPPVAAVSLHRGVQRRDGDVHAHQRDPERRDALAEAPDQHIEIVAGEAFLDDPVAQGLDRDRIDGPGGVRVNEPGLLHRHCPLRPASSGRWGRRRQTSPLAGLTRYARGASPRAQPSRISAASSA